MSDGENGRQPAGPRPILADKDYSAPSVFAADGLVVEARRRKGLPEARVPAICAFDPDGDLVDHLWASGRARRDAAWACYHTRLDVFEHEGLEIGIVGSVVGAPFAELVAEELFASGCQLLISVTSAGQIVPLRARPRITFALASKISPPDGLAFREVVRLIPGRALSEPPYVVLIERAVRDEGTSYHHRPPAPFSQLRPELAAMLKEGRAAAVSLHAGASLTTDAPFRETAAAISAARDRGVLAVETEPSALYALAQAKGLDIVCFAHVTNQRAQTEGDFEKGEAKGSVTALRVIGWTARRWLAATSDRSARRGGTQRATVGHDGGRHGL